MVNRFHRWYCGTGHWARVVQAQLVPWALQGIDLGADVLEIGPGPGRSTALLARRASSVTAVELDPALAAATAVRLASSPNVRVEVGDGTALDYPDASFDAVVCFTMLHHVPSTALQDALFGEARRVLRPGGWFAGTDSVPTPVFRAAHVHDTMVPVRPATLSQRLAGVGLVDITVDAAAKAFRWRAARPQDSERPTG